MTIQELNLIQETRAKFVQAIKNAIKAKGPLLLSALRSVLTQEDVDVSIYEWCGPKRWLQERFPEFIVDGSPDTIMFSPSMKLTELQRSTLAGFFREEIKGKGWLFCASVPSVMRANWFPDWKELAGSSGLPAWLESTFPEFLVTDKNGAKALFLPEKKDKKQAQVRDDQNVPAARFANIPLNPYMAQLRQLTGDDALKGSQGRETCYERLTQYLLGVTDGFFDASTDEEPRLAFNTGLKTADEQHIFACLEKNGEQGAPYWRLAGFCYPGQQDEAGLGGWLCQRFGLRSENAELIQRSYGQILQAVEKIKTLGQTLSAQMDQAAALVAAGRPVPAQFVETVTGYGREWDTLRQAAAATMLDLPAEQLSLADIEELVSGETAISVQLDNAHEAFCALSSAVWSYLLENMLCDGDGAEEDAAAWKRLCDAAAAGQFDRDGFRGLLAPYKAVQELTKERTKFDAAAGEALSAVNEHFGTELVPATIRVTFMLTMKKDPAAFSCLEKLPVIEACLSNAQSLLQHTVQSDDGPVAKSAAPAMGYPELLRAVTEGEYVTGSILSSYERPDALELAIMQGQTDKARAQLFDDGYLAASGFGEQECRTIDADLEKLIKLQEEGQTSFYTAGRRLAVVLGNRRGQAERCFLISLSLGNFDALPWLGKIYLDANRVTETGILYRAYKDKMSAAARRSSLNALVLAGAADIREAMEEDVLYFLDANVIRRFSGRLSEGAERDLTMVCDALQTELVRHIVFDDSELRNYVMQPENLQPIQALDIGRTTAEMISTAKFGTYSKGNGLLSVAERIYEFIGRWNGLAEALASLAPDSDRARALLFRMYQETDDNNGMFALLHSDPVLQKEHHQLYGQVLFSRGEYELYYDECIAGQTPGDIQEQLRFVIAAIHAGHWDGTVPELGPDEDIGQVMPLILQLAVTLREHGLTEELYHLQIGLFDRVADSLDADVLHDLVTVCGAADGEHLAQLQQQADAAGCRGLVVYCCNVLGVNSGAYESQASACFDELMAASRDAVPQERIAAIRRIQMLFPGLSEQSKAELTPRLLEAYTETLPYPDGADTLAGLFTPEMGRDTVLALITVPAEDESEAWRRYVTDERIYRPLASLCQEHGLRQQGLAFFHRHRDGAGAGYADFLCGLYVDALKDGSFPEGLTEQAERYMLDTQRETLNNDIAAALYLLEKQRGRTQFADLAFLYLQQQPLSESAAQWLEQERSAAPERAGETELSLFASMLEARSGDMDEYLRFCSVFFREEDDGEATEPSLDQSYVSEAESSHVLHRLYAEPHSADAWTLCQKLPLQDRPAIFASLLLRCAQVTEQSGSPLKTSNDAWDECAGYCRQNDQNDILLQTLIDWMGSLLQRPVLHWYAGKELFGYVNSICQDPDMKDAWTAADAEPLVQLLCRFFIRISSGVASGENHITLRSIIEIASLTDNEQVIVASPEMMNSLFGQYRKLCFVLALRLLHAGKAEKSRELLVRLAALQDGMPYIRLVKQLAEMDPEQLDQWRQTDVARSLTDVILPDGNAVSSLAIRTLLMKHVLEGTQSVGVQVVEELLRCDEHDSVLYTALFILCKSDGLNELERIYRALDGVFRNYSVNDRGNEQTTRYTRNRDEVFRLLLITRIVMERRNMPVPDADRQLNDFLRDAAMVAGRDESTFVTELTAHADSVRNRYVGCSEEAAGWWDEAFMAAVTGGWEPFLRRAYAGGVTGCYLDCAEYNSWGLLRGCLLVVKDMPDSEKGFLDWVRSSVTAGSVAERRINAICNGVQSFWLKNDWLKGADQRLLALPLEEQLVCLGTSDDLSRPEINSCYGWLRQNVRLPQLKCTLRMFVDLGASWWYKGFVLYDEARHYFDRGDDAKAFVYFQCLWNFAKKGNVKRQMYPVFRPENEPEKVREYRMEYECCMYITGALSVDGSTLKRLASLDGQRCYCMVMTLLQSKRADELHHIAGLLFGANRRLCLDILQLVDPGLSDEEKSEIARRYSGGALERAIAKLLGTTESDDGKPLFVIRDPELRRRYAERYVHLTMKLGDEPPYLVPLSKRPNASAFAQKDEAPELDGQPAQGKPDVPFAEEDDGDGQSVRTPSFALDVQGAYSGEQLPALEEIQERYRACLPLDLNRSVLSGQIYCVLCRNGADEAQVQDALLCYGLDYWAQKSSDEDKSAQAQAFRAMRELAVYCDLLQLSGGRYDAFAIQAPNILRRGLQSFDDVDSLVADYDQDAAGYNTLFAMASDEAPFLTTVQSVIRQLSRAYAAILGPKQLNVEAYKLAYGEARRSLGGMNIPMQFSDWKREARSHLISLLIKAQNALDQRPDLSVTVLNVHGASGPQGSIFGQISNAGREPATDIVLQASFMDDQTSNSYTYASLLPRASEKVTFAIPYRVDGDVQSMPYTLSVTYTHNQKQMNREPESGVLAIRPQPAPDFETGLYMHQRPIYFHVDQSGELVGDGFFGREEQLGLLRKAVSGRTFAEYSDVVIQGVHRSGKTTLLNYLDTYIRAKVDNAVVVSTDGQGVDAQPIYKVFVKPVLKELGENVSGLGAQVPGLAQTDEWQAIVDEWTLADDAQDTQPDDLEYFYLKVKQAIAAAQMKTDGYVMGTGLVLIVDEFDEFLNRLQARKADMDIVFLEGLRRLTKQAHDAVHFVVCGSNRLMKYKREGERYFQAFQVFDQIVVDDLPAADMIEMLKAPYKDHPEVVITQEAIDWVLRYTGGLIWHTKLLANAMLHAAKEDGRSVVYPTDVCRAFQRISGDKVACLQFYEGCEDREMSVIGAMAELSTRYMTTVSFGELREKLSDTYTDAQIKAALDILITLRLIESSPSGYCFRRELYRRFFRSQVTNLTGPSLGDEMEVQVMEKKQRGPFSAPI